MARDPAGRWCLGACGRFLSWDHYWPRQTRCKGCRKIENRYEWRSRSERRRKRDNRVRKARYWRDREHTLALQRGYYWKRKAGRAMESECFNALPNVGDAPLTRSLPDSPGL